MPVPGSNPSISNNCTANNFYHDRISDNYTSKNISNKLSANDTCPDNLHPDLRGTIGDILGRASGVASMKYDMVTTTANNQTVTATMFVKKTKIRMETTQQGQNVVMLINSDTKTMYMYTPTQNTAIKLDFSQAPKSASDNSNSILQNNPTIVGTETLDGKVCTAIQYTASGGTSKVWIWTEKGLPVRVQATTSQGTSTTDFKNYDFSDIADSMFELPAALQISHLGLPAVCQPVCRQGFRPICHPDIRPICQAAVNQRYDRRMGKGSGNLPFFRI